jgi:hypothetical protein
VLLRLLFLCSVLWIIICFLLSVGHCTALPQLGWPLSCLTSSRLAIVLPYLISVGHCTALTSSTYHFWDHYLFYSLGWTLYCLTFLNLPLLISLFVLISRLAMYCLTFSRLAIVLAYLPQLTTSDYAFGIFKLFFQANILLTHERHVWIFDPVDVLLWHFLTSVFTC